MESLSQIISSVTNNGSVNMSEFLQIENMSPQLLEALQNGIKADLKLVMNETNLQTTLIVDGKNFEVDIKGKLPNMIEGETLNIPMRVVSGNRLVPQVNDSVNQLSKIKQNEVATKIDVDFNQQLKSIKLAPLKLDEIITSKMQELNIPETVKEQVMSEIPRLHAVISSLGNIESAPEELLQPLYNTIKQLATMSDSKENVVVIKDQLRQNIDALIGKQLGGEVTAKVNDLTVIKTDLGQTYFNSPVKINENEALVLTLDKTIFLPKDEESFLQQLIGILGGKGINNSSIFRSAPDFLSSFSLPKQLIQNQDFVRLIANKIPTLNKDFMVNTANFYQAAVKKDGSIWLGKENLSQIFTSTGKEMPHLVSSLDNMVASSVKETPLWRIVEIPIYADNQITPLKVALKKRQQSEEQKSSEKKGTRFVVETNFSKMGGFQFDGFVQARERNLDLIIRTSQNQKEDFYTNVINLFKNTLYNLDYTGNIKINNKDNFINFYQDYPQKEGLYI